MFESMIQGFKTKFSSALPTKFFGLHDTFLLVSFNRAHSYVWAFPSGWGRPHLTKEWAQEAGSGTCLIYMESCNEVTRKNEMNKCKDKAPLYALVGIFLLTILKFEYSRPLVLPKNAARSQQKKGIVRWGSARSEPNNTRNWALPNYFLSCPPRSAWAAETSVSVSVTNFHNQLKIYDQCSSNSWWTKK